MANYDQGRYPVIPPIDGSPHYMQYTNAGIQPVINQQRQQCFSAVICFVFGTYHASYRKTDSFRKEPVACPLSKADGPVPNQQSGSNHIHQSGPQQEKYIYYGPNGNILPGPPSHNHRMAVPPQDFTFEGIVYYGRLRQINLILSSLGFPKIPDYVVKDLLEKYGQFERTTVRVAARLGRCFVHATPHIRNNPQLQPEYVYIVEDEDFNYEKFLAEYRQGNAFRRRQPWRRGREELFRRDAAYSPAFRPNTDAYENGRWRRDDDRYTTAGRRTAPTRVENWVYRTVAGDHCLLGTI